MVVPAQSTPETAPDLIRDTAIREIQAKILNVPTTRRHKLSNTAVTHQNYVHVQVRFDNGVIGHGEAATLGGPRWSEESVEAIKANIDTYLAPALIGTPGCHLEAANLRLDAAAKRNASAKSALSAALMDALGRTLDLPATAFLGGAVRDRISVIWALASGDVIQEVEEAKAKIAARQFNRFKIKLGFADIHTDLRRLDRLRTELPEGTEIIADINQGWSEADCRKWLPSLEALDISLIEQPLDAGNMAGMARLAKISRIPLMLDEGVFTPQEAFHGAATGAGSVLSLKLCKHGSAQALQRVAGIAFAGGQELYGGCLLESSLGAAAHLAVFATLPSLTWGCEHFGPLILSEDTVEASLIYEDFHVLVPQGPGLGVTPDPAKTARFERKN
ncbi:mandelate racemase [Ruegeria sp. HKCCD4884]|uniref:muconate/chloromuconate family cycloisomerase n=1 Tax=Ruegeria sp. HKCCD4884 TaxID=2683022 RepID=UPI0014928F40|nr:muconate/chloromuconate family cycloisomerase [Ruegeria sp. HKCCD4884]NOD93171.1 mandelate racemase [Ruegeria sp. HKCCD4884]